jgi:NAD(P)H dehydrogenase (quinone)
VQCIPLGRPIRYYDLPIADFQTAAAAIPHLGSHVGQHIGAVMVDLQRGLLSGTTDTVERLTGTPPMSVHDFIEANRDLYAPSAANATV